MKKIGEMYQHNFIQHPIAIEWIEKINKAQDFDFPEITGAMMTLELGYKKNISTLGKYVVKENGDIHLYPGQIFIKVPKKNLGDKAKKPEHLWGAHWSEKYPDSAISVRKLFGSTTRDRISLAETSDKLSFDDPKDMYPDHLNLIYTEAELLALLGVDEYDDLLERYEDLYSINLKLIDAESHQEEIE